MVSAVAMTVPPLAGIVQQRGKCRNAGARHVRNVVAVFASIVEALVGPHGRDSV
jgi:hypothetical protein